MEHHNIFSLERNEIGCTDAAEHIIELLDTEPFKERFHHIAPPLVEEVREHLQEMLDGGAIRPSQSPWCNAVVLVRKKDGGLRFCIDFHRLNSQTKKDAYPLPRMQETMESMVGTQFFSTMDLKSGFWQVKMAKDSQQYTTFMVGSMGVYEFLRMPYGLCNTLATFQRLMQNCLAELNLTYALIYLDNVIVFSHTEEEHLHHLRVVFGQFLEHRLKLKPSKCHFLQDKITFLGHEISADGMRPGTANLKAIAEMAPPKTYTEIRRFTGMTGFFRRFIKGYAKIAKPLNDLLEGEASKLKNEELELMPEALQAFEDLKKKCMTAPVLVFADFNKPFQLETDASGEGLGAILLQESDDGQYHLVAFTSRELKGGEPKYHSSKLKWPRGDKSTLAEYLAGVASEYEKHFYAAHQKEFTIQDNLLYLQATPTNSQDSASVFVVLANDRQAAIDGCHHSAGHQGFDHTLSLMKEHFWWPRMSKALIKAVAHCGRCIQYEAKGQLPPMQPIICTEPMELVHIDYVGMEVTIATDKKPEVKNVLVVVDHFTRYVQAFVMKNHTARTDGLGAVQQLLLRLRLPTAPYVRPRN